MATDDGSCGGLISGADWDVQPSESIPRDVVCDVITALQKQGWIGTWQWKAADGCWHAYLENPASTWSTGLKGVLDTLRVHPDTAKFGISFHQDLTFGVAICHGDGQPTWAKKSVRRKGL